MQEFDSIAPGRLCLFGEHQDYLGLPVIAVALPLCCKIQVCPLEGSKRLKLEFDGELWSVDLDNLPPKQIPKDGDQLDFALAAVHEALKDGWIFACGANCVSTTELPLQAGCSSSSAFCVAWVQVLAKLCHKALTRLELAQMAHRAEVLHFGSPGGTMDHMTSALGGVLRIGPGMWEQTPLPIPADAQWILAYSGEPKDTLKHLRRCKTDRLNLLDKLGGSWDNNNNVVLTTEEKILLEATRTNRDMEQRAFASWGCASGQDLGGWMMKHHEALRDGLKLSTPRLESMREAAMTAGAWGFKVVGSGGGGCAVAWAPGGTMTDKIVTALTSVGATRVWTIRQAHDGARCTDHSNNPS